MGFFSQLKWARANERHAQEMQEENERKAKPTHTKEKTRKITDDFNL